MTITPTLILIAMAITHTPIVIMVLGGGDRVTGVMVDGVIMVLGVRVTGVMVAGVIMVTGVRVTGVMVEGAIMALGVRVTEVMVEEVVLGVQVPGVRGGTGDNTFFGQLH
jgi:hypothetical protein